ncbi:glucose-1-phosphate cytidylyltransferase [Rapidithrix thailandica]|uniref:Glucose-1-phosphate cytidylyltransferase n=1 Tax=Rapidithrix thailandica TaxID=413964 RepID=A0AAW9S0Z5_9BACT
MKVLILAGGFGTRLSEETHVRPKPMAEIGGKPILWHIMNIYSKYGLNEFVILLGYKGAYIKEYFYEYYLHNTDFTIDLSSNQIETHSSNSEPWKVTLLDTGLHTMTGGRIKRAADFIQDETFLLTYGDGVSDVNIEELLSFHRSHGGAITMTSVMPDGRFGALQIDGENKVNSFMEKPKGDGKWINGGFFVCEPKVLEYINNGDGTIFEREPLEKLAKDGELYAYHHYGFWQCMDTLSDKKKLNQLWDKGQAKW